MKRYIKMKERTGYSPGLRKKINMNANRFVSHNMRPREYEEFIWDLLKMLDSLGTLKSGIIED
jgi:hypothetical protein